MPSVLADAHEVRSMIGEQNDQLFNFPKRPIVRRQIAKILLLTFAVLPTAVVAVMAIYIWLTNNSANLRWNSEIWLVVVWQILAIIAFIVHVSRNQRLASDERGGWIFQIILYIPFGMISYWKKQVWDPIHLDPR